MTTITAAEARAWLVHSAAFDETFPAGGDGVRRLLRRLGVIQIDPIDRVGTNPDLVAFSRVDGLQRGDVYRHLSGVAFEHFAKERCLIDVAFFPYYRDQALETGWWRHSERLERIPGSALEEVLSEIRERGPLPAEALSERGRTGALDWSGWKGTSKVSVLAAEVLWTTCRLVVAARDTRGRRLYDLPERALGAAASAPRTGPYAETSPATTLLLERVRAAGLLSRASGPMWSMLKDSRKDGTVDHLLANGRLQEVQVEGSTRRYLALPAIEGFKPSSQPDVLRVLAPLDPLLWDRDLVRTAFSFDYVWEIYKPASERQWGYYVCPLLLRDRLIGRLEGRRDRETLRILRIWGDPPPDLLRATLSRLSEQNGCKNFIVDASRENP